jgi:HK97 gp10 family phage protein
VSSFEALIGEFRRAAVTAPIAASVVVRRTALAIEADAKVNAPVDTGALRNSISTDVALGEVITAEIGPTVDYGIYVERGTEYMDPEPYLGPAYDAHAGEVFDAALVAATGLGGGS